MELALCILIAVILICFALLIVVSGISFKFNVSKEGFQSLGQQQQAPQQQAPQQQAPQQQAPQQQAPQQQILQVPGAISQIIPDVNDMAVADRAHLFHSNECKPECCTNGRGTFSCSTGCVCITDDQLDMITNRGGNNTSSCK